MAGAAAEQRSLIQGLAEHIVHDCARVRSFMATHLVAFLLLVKHRNGVSESKLVESFNTLKDLIIARGHDLGFCGKTSDVVQLASALLGDHLVIVETQKAASVLKTSSSAAGDNVEAAETVFVPALTLPAVLELAYYANCMATAFVFDGVLATAVLSLNGAHAELRMNNNVVDDDIRGPLISRDSLMKLAGRLCMLLKYEFIFVPSCGHVELALIDTLEHFVTSQLISVVDNEEQCNDSVSRKQWSRSFELEADEDEDDDERFYENVFYHVNRETAESLEHLQHWTNIVGPLIEAYYVTACNVTHLQENDMKEDVFHKMVLASLIGRASSGVAAFPESCSLDTVKNAASSFRSLGVLELYMVDSVRMVGLGHSI
jgi:glycerol-3-phosphate O-acyltransferase 1/2